MTDSSKQPTPATIPPDALGTIEGIRVAVIVLDREFSTLRDSLARQGSVSAEGKAEMARIGAQITALQAQLDKVNTGPFEKLLDWLGMNRGKKGSLSIYIVLIVFGMGFLLYGCQESLIGLAERAIDAQARQAREQAREADASEDAAKALEEIAAPEDDSLRP